MTEFHRIGRERLPNRRASVTAQASWNGRTFHVTVGFTDDCRVLEIFARDAGKHDSEQDRLVDDIAVLLSRTLQHGDKLAQIAEGLGHDHGGEPSSLVGVLVAAAQQVEREVTP